MREKGTIARTLKPVSGDSGHIPGEGEPRKYSGKQIFHKHEFQWDRTSFKDDEEELIKEAKRLFNVIIKTPNA